MNIDFNENIIDKEIQDEGYVDLGLPSGKLWASCNLGASKPYESGNYYAWGETEPKGDYSWKTYKWCNMCTKKMIKYCHNPSHGTADYKMELEPEDDAVYVATAGEAHIPTKNDIIELYKNTDHTWCTCSVCNENENIIINGRLFTSKTDSTKRIFIPAAGYQYGVSMYNPIDDFYVWTSSLDEHFSGNAWHLFSYSISINDCSHYRYCGFSVRGVKDAQ